MTKEKTEPPFYTLLDAARLAKKDGLTERTHELYSRYLDGEERDIRNIPERCRAKPRYIDGVYTVYTCYGLRPEDVIRKQFTNLAEIAVEAEMYDQASEFYEKAGDIWGAAHNAKKTGSMDRAIELLERSGKFYDAARMALDIRRGFPAIITQVYCHTLSVQRGTVELQVEDNEPQRAVNRRIISRARQSYEKAIAQSKELLSQINDDNYHKNGQGNYTNLLIGAEDAMSVGLEDVARQMVDITEQIHHAYVKNNWTWILFP